MLTRNDKTNKNFCIYSKYCIVHIYYTLPMYVTSLIATRMKR